MAEIIIFSEIISICILIYFVLINQDIKTKIIGANICGTLITITFITIALTQKIYYLVDIAMVYCLINFVATIVLVKYFKTGNLKGKIVND